MAVERRCESRHWVQQVLLGNVCFGDAARPAHSWRSFGDVSKQQTGQHITGQEGIYVDVCNSRGHI